MSEPEEITTMSGQKLQLKMSVDYISFSAHTDYQQTSEFIRALKPPHVVSWLIVNYLPRLPLWIILCIDLCYWFVLGSDPGAWRTE